MQCPSLRAENCQEAQEVIFLPEYKFVFTLSLSIQQLGVELVLAAVSYVSLREFSISDSINLYRRLGVIVLIDVALPAFLYPSINKT